MSTIRGCWARARVVSTTTTTTTIITTTTTTIILLLPLLLLLLLLMLLLVETTDFYVQESGMPLDSRPSLHESEKYRLTQDLILLQILYVKQDTQNECLVIV